MPLPRIQRSVRSSLPNDAITKASPVRYLWISHEGKKTRAAADHLLDETDGTRICRIRSREQTVQLTLLAVVQHVHPLPFIAGEIEEADDSITRRLRAGAAGEARGRASAEQPQQIAAVQIHVVHDGKSAYRRTSQVSRTGGARGSLCYNSRFMRLATARPAPVAGAGLEHELKFVLPAARAEGALGLLRSLCRPDPQYRAAFVSTIYFDTPWLELLAAKVDSDYLKLKVRLRWYDSTRPDAAAFLELKTRVGSLRHKIRLPTGLSPAWLDGVSMEDPELLRVLDLAEPVGIPLPGPLMPALMLRYKRHRFVELASGARVTLDTDIEVPRAHKGLFHGAAAAALPVAVLEVKGDADDLPPTMRPLLHLGARRGSFSKYGIAAREVLGILG